MSNSQCKWDRRYSASTVDDAEPGRPLDALHKYAGLLPAGGRALDLACGRAANAEFLARCGFEVSAWDISGVVIEQVRERFREADLSADLQARDVLAEPPAADSFDLIVVAHFLERALATPLAAALKPGGLLFYQTFVVDNPDGHGPSNSDFLLQSGELLQLFSALTPRVFFDLGSLACTEQGSAEIPVPCGESLLIAQKPHLQ